MNVMRLLQNIWKVSILKTIIFNFKYFQLKTAILFPVIIYDNVILRKIKGKIILQEKPKFGTIKIGVKTNRFLTSKDKLIWDMNGGVLIFSNWVALGQSLYMYIGEKGTVKVGKNTVISGGKNGKLIATNNIQIGNNCRIAADVEIIDTSFHYLINTCTNDRNEINGRIIVGDNCWIGSHSKIYKNTRIADFTTIGSNSVTRKNYGDEKYGVYGGNPAKLISNGWYRDLAYSDS